MKGIFFFIDSKWIIIPEDVARPYKTGLQILINTFKLIPQLTITSSVLKRMARSFWMCYAK